MARRFPYEMWVSLVYHLIGVRPGRRLHFVHYRGMQDRLLAFTVAMGAAIGAMSGLLIEDTGTGLVGGFVIGTLAAFAWAWNRDLDA